MIRAVVTALVCVVAGCTTYDSPLAGRGSDGEAPRCVDRDGDGFGRDCGEGPDCDDHDPALSSGPTCPACVAPDDGCPCEVGAGAVSCFLEKTVAGDGTVMCHEGTRYCRGGAWSACEDVHSYPMPSEVGANAIIDRDAPPEHCNDCNVKCFVIRDNLDPVDGGLDGGQVEWGSGGGLTLGAVPDASWTPPPPDADYGTGPTDNPDEDAPCTPGTAPDWDCDDIEDRFDPHPFDKPFATASDAIFLDIAPGETGTGVVDLTFYLRSMDVYFLVDATKTMQAVHTKLQSVLINGTFLGSEVECVDSDLDGTPDQDLKEQGLIGAIRCIVRDANIGAGFVREIPFDPYGDIDEITFRHLVDVTSNAAAVRSAIDTIENQRDRDWPDAHTMALYSLTTGNGLYMGLTRPGVAPRVGCPEETWGYPCFREDVLPVVVLVTDAPMHNGPFIAEQSYQYPIDYDPAKLQITSGTTAGYLELPVTNERFSSAYDVGNAGTKYVTYAGDTRVMESDYGTATLSCLAAGSAGAPDAAFTFTLSTTKQVTLSTAGSGFSAALGLYSHSAESPRALTSDASNENWLQPHDAGDVYTQWKVVSGTTAGMAADYTGAFVGCTAEDTASDAVFRFSLLKDTRVRLDTTGSAFDTVLSLHSEPPVLAEAAATNNTNDVGASAQYLGDVYQRDVSVSGGNSAATTIAADYTALQVGCTADTDSPDAVYRFSLSKATRVRLSTVGSSFDTVLALTDGDFGSPLDVGVSSANEAQASAYDAGNVVGTWKRLLGTTLGMNANYRDAFVGCGAGTTSPDAVFEFSLASDTRVRLDTTGSAFDTVVSLHNGAIDPVASLTNGTNTNEVAPSAFALGTINDAWYEVSGATTTAMNDDYLGETVGCGASSTSPDAVYAFTVAASTRVRVDTVGSSFDTMLALHDAPPPYHVDVPLAPTPELHDIGSLNNTSRVFTGNTTALTSDYGGLSMGCGAYDATHDIAFKFHVDLETGVEINTSGSGYDTVIGLYPDTIKAPKEPPAIIVPNTNETKATATNAGAIDSGWQVFSGSTASMVSNFGDFGCSAAANARDAVVRFRLDAPHNVRVDTGGSSFDTVIGVFRWADDVLVACDADSGPGETSVLTTLLPVGEYYVVLKGDGPSDKGPYKLSVRDLDAANVLVCDDDLGGGGASKIIARLVPGDYHVLIKGKTPPSDGPFQIRFTDRDWFSIKHRIACDDNGGGASDSLIEQDLAPGTYYAIVKGDLSTEKGPYKVRVRDASSAAASSHNLACNDDGASPPVSRVEQDLTAGTYWAVLKGKGTAAGGYQLALRDLGSGAVGERIDCNDDDPAGGTHSVIERDLAAGTYLAYVKGGVASAKGPYALRVTDVTNTGTGTIVCDDDGAGGTASGIEQDLVAGTYWAILKGGAASPSGAYSLTLRDMNSVTRQALACELDGKHTISLPSGTYDVLVKGTSNGAKGPYQLTIGNGQTMAATFNPPTWVTTLDAMNDRDVRVVTILNCHDNGLHGDGRECDDARSQAIEIANATNALGIDFAPLVFDIDGNGEGLEEAVLDAVRELSGNLGMDVSVRVVFDPDANPGFGVVISAVDQPGDGCDGLVGITHQDCVPGATPTFHIAFTNPHDDPVPLNPNDPKGGYWFRADLIASGKYFVAAVPIYIIPRDVDGSAPGTEPLLYDTGIYVQDIDFPLGCIGTESPDWSHLTWSADLPAGTAIDFAACTADTPAELDACAPIVVARVVGTGACTNDAMCGLGFCAQNGVCQTITSGVCVDDSQCALGADCVSGTCVYAGQPVYIGSVLGPGNFLPNLRMRITLSANVAANDAPTLFDWALTYLCRGNL
jgi:hypothetical protein